MKNSIYFFYVYNRCLKFKISLKAFPLVWCYMFLNEFAIESIITLSKFKKILLGKYIKIFHCSLTFFCAKKLIKLLTWNPIKKVGNMFFYLYNLSYKYNMYSGRAYFLIQLDVDNS